MGSGILDALAIRDAEDIDLVVSESIFENLRSSGWQEDREFLKKYGRRCLKMGNIEVYDNFNIGDYNLSLADIPFKTLSIRGVTFMSLEELLKFKRILNREKDQRDIELIENYLKVIE